MSKQAQPPELIQALESIKQGNYLAGLLKLTQLKDHMITFDDPLLPQVLVNYRKALGQLFSENLIKTEGSLDTRNELNISVHLFNLGDIYSYLKMVMPETSKRDIRQYKRLAQLYEKWVLDSLKNIIKKELKDVDNLDQLNSLIGKFSRLNYLFDTHFLPQIEDIQRTKYSTTSIIKYREKIYSALQSKFYDYAKDSITGKNLIKSYRMLQKSQLLYDLYPENSNFGQKIGKLKKDILELKADYESEAGEYHEKKDEFDRALIYYKEAFRSYKLVNSKLKKIRAKHDYLKVNLAVAKQYIEEADELVKHGDDDSALFKYRQAISEFKKINAARDLAEAKNKVNAFYVRLGDKKFEEAQKITGQSMEELSHAINLFRDARHWYYEAESGKKFKALVVKISKMREAQVRLLIKEIKDYHKQGEYEREYLSMEDLIQLYYELDKIPEANNYAKQMDRIHGQINTERLQFLHKLKIESQPWLESEKNAVYAEELEEDENLKHRGSPFSFPGSNNPPMPFKKKTAVNFSGYKVELSDSEVQTEQILAQDFNPDLKAVYQIIKMYNDKLFLTDEQVNFLKKFSINLPDDEFYYHKYPNTEYQFYVHENKIKQIRVMVIPTRNLIIRMGTLGLLAENVDPFIPVDEHFFESHQILHSHILFSSSDSKWHNLMELSEISTFDKYLNLLNGVRLFISNSGSSEIARYLNSSVIEEYINTPNDKLVNYLMELKQVNYIEEILAWTTNPNLRLFLMGLYLIQKKELVTASIFWSMMYIS